MNGETQKAPRVEIKVFLPEGYPEGQHDRLRKIIIDCKMQIIGKLQINCTSTEVVEPDLSALREALMKQPQEIRIGVLEPVPVSKWDIGLKELKERVENLENRFKPYGVAGGSRSEELGRAGELGAE